MLVVDDDDAMRELVSSALEAEGYAVHTADHGGAALERLREADQPDLVLLDLEMPVMDGWQLLTEMRAMDSCSAIPVLVMSGSTPEDAPAGVPFIAKPASVCGLLAAVRRATRGRRRRKRRALHRATHGA